MKIEEPIAVNTDIPSKTSDLVSEEPPIAFIEPKELPRLIPSATFIPSSVGVNRLRSSDPPLDYSGLTASVSFEQSSIPADPAHPEFGSTNTNTLNYEAGYRFDRFEEAGIGYSRQIFRDIYSTTKTLTVVGGSGGFIHITTWHDSDDPISLPGIYYTFHANNLEILGVEPFATAFASKPNAGFLWRASAGLELNAWDNLNAVITYSREQLNSATYAAPQNIHSFFSFGLSYRLLP